MNAVVAAVSRSAKHTLVKANQDSIRLLPGLGVDGDAHQGATVKHRSRVARDPRAVLYGNALMRVAVDAEPGQEPDAVPVEFDHGMLRAAADCPDHCVHRFSSGDRHAPLRQF